MAVYIEEYFPSRGAKYVHRVSVHLNCTYYRPAIVGSDIGSCISVAASIEML